MTRTCPTHPDRPWKPWSKVGCVECQKEHARLQTNARKREYRKRHDVEATPAAKARRIRYDASDKRKAVMKRYNQKRPDRQPKPVRLCSCGCGAEVKHPKRLTTECAHRKKLARLAEYKKSVAKLATVKLCACGCGRPTEGRKTMTEKCYKRAKSIKAKAAYKARKKPPMVRERPFAEPVVKKAVDDKPLPPAPAELLKRAAENRQTLKWGRWGS